MRHVFSAVLLLALGGAASCTESVNVEFDSCDDDGVVVNVGEVVPTKDGCGTCTCEPNGLMSCDTRTCCVAPDESTFSPGDVWSDGCTTCECEADGSVGCSSTTVCGCLDAPPCEEVSGCTSVSMCDESTGWTCSYECIDTCDPSTVPSCDSPLGCVTDVLCDESTNTWFCGPTTCDCVGSPGECASLPGCSSNLVCDTFSGAWYCEDVCPCGMDVPNCGYFATPACLTDTWICESPGSTCGEAAEPCPFHEDFNCANFPICDPTAMQTWTCTEECITEYCPAEPEPCPPEPADCFYFPLCQLTGWECVLYCN